MATYMALLNFTEQGVRAYRETSKRAEAFSKSVEQAGGKLRDVYWTMGPYDGVVIFEAPDDQAAATVMFELGSKGNVRSQKMRAFDRAEIGRIIGG